MANTMGGARYAGQACTDNGNFRAQKVRVWRWRIGRKDEIQKPLKQGVKERNGVELCHVQALVKGS